MEEKTVTIDIGRYDELLDIETRKRRNCVNL